MIFYTFWRRYLDNLSINNLTNTHKWLIHWNEYCEKTQNAAVFPQNVNSLEMVGDTHNLFMKCIPREREREAQRHTWLIHVVLSKHYRTFWMMWWGYLQFDRLQQTGDFRFEIFLDWLFTRVVHQNVDICPLIGTFLMKWSSYTNTHWNSKKWKSTEGAPWHQTFQWIGLT